MQGLASSSSSFCFLPMNFFAPPIIPHHCQLVPLSEAKKQWVCQTMDYNFQALSHNKPSLIINGLSQLFVIVTLWPTQNIDSKNWGIDIPDIMFGEGFWNTFSEIWKTLRNQEEKAWNSVNGAKRRFRK